jgi:GH3 auxin-responsive promoter.
MSIPLLGTIIKTAAEIKNFPVEIKQKRIEPVKAQKKELKKLLRKAKNTAFGKEYHFQDILDSDDIISAFKQNVPIYDYNKNTQRMVVSFVEW